MTARIDRLWPDAAHELTDDELTTSLGAGVRVNFVSSIDGAATHDGLSGALSTPGDERYFELLRRVCDVVLVGAGTVRAEGYGPMRVSAASARWRTERGMPEHPVFAIVSGSLDLDPRSRVFTEAPVRPTVITTARATHPDRFADVADVLIAGSGESIAPGVAVAGLHDRGLASILCEGGPSLFAAMLAADVVDELCLTVSPSLEAGAAPRITSGPAAPHGMRLTQVHKSGDTLLLRYGR